VFDYIERLQSETQALDDRISEPYGVREPGGISLSRCHPNRVQARLSVPETNIIFVRLMQSQRVVWRADNVNGLCGI
jgi:hypothetical protein